MTKEQELFLIGAIFAVFGLYVIVSSHDLVSGFFLIGLGIAFMATSNKDFRKQFFDFILSIFKGLWKLLSRS